MTKIKSLYFGILFLMISGSILGQTNKYDVGVEAGPGLIFLWGNDILAKQHNMTIGGSAGLFFQRNYTNALSLRTGIAYERKGSVAHTQGYDYLGNPTGEVKTRVHYNYLTIPILARATFGKNGQFFVNAGPYLGYLLRQAFVTKGNTSNNTLNNKELDFGLTTGLGFTVPYKTKYAFSFEVRNNLGLFNVSAIPVFNDGAIRTNSTNFLFGFTYKVGQGN